MTEDDFDDDFDMDDEFESSSMIDLQFNLTPSKAHYFQGESIDVVLSVSNPDSLNKRCLLSLIPGNQTVLFTLESENGELIGPVGDNELARVRGELPDVDFESEESELSAGEEFVEIFDLLPRAGQLNAGHWKVNCELVNELTELETQIEIDPAVTIHTAAGNWEYGRGADSFGFCAWSTDVGSYAGTYLRVQAAYDGNITLANRRISKHIARRGLSVARAASYFASRRHVLWIEKEYLHIVIVEDDVSVAEYEISASGFLQAWADPLGGLLLARCYDNQLVLERLLMNSNTCTTLSSLVMGAFSGELVAAWVSAYGTCWLASFHHGKLSLYGTQIDKQGELKAGSCYNFSLFVNDGSQEKGISLSTLVPVWLDVSRGPDDEEGEQAQVLALMQISSGEYVLFRCIPGKEPQQLAKGTLPAGKLHDGIFMQRLHLLIENGGQLVHATMPGNSTVLGEGFSPL